MKQLPILIAIALLGLALFACQTNAVIPETDAKAYLKNGAPVLDVRTVAEFETRHLPNTVNIPLNEVKDKVPLLFTNKSRVILLHCRSGHRSGIAVSELQKMGYTNAFNIGSFSQAEKIVTGNTP